MRGGENEELLFHGYQVSFGDDGKFLEMDGGMVAQRFE